jgi:UDP-glucose 4-epimerase
LLAANSENANNQVFNISFGQGRKIAELAQIVQTMFPSVKIKNNECKPFRPNRGAMNIEKARQLLNYEPFYTLEEGMQIYRNFVFEHIALY